MVRSLVGRRRVPLAVIALAATLGAFPFATRPAFADVVPPAGDCEGKKEGDACKDPSGPGACGTITTTALNHATTPPTESQRSYFGCKAGVKARSGSGCEVVAPGSGSGPPLGGVAALASVALGGAALRRRRQRP